MKRKGNSSESCPKCGRDRDNNWLPYCTECFNGYQRERRKNNPELKKKATEYKREYRSRIRKEKMDRVKKAVL